MSVLVQIVSCLSTVSFSMFYLSTDCLPSAAAISAVMKNETDRLSLLAFKKEVTLDPTHVFSSWNDSVHFCFWPGVTCARKHQRVVALNLSSHALAGTLTPHLGNLSFLRGVYLQNNRFHGAIPQELDRLFRLEDLALRENSFEGRIPTNLSSCPHLTTLSLAHNELDGRIPAELGSLPRLGYLNLESNSRLSGVIPPSLGNLSSLVDLRLGGCNLEGTIPPELGQLLGLKYFSLLENHLGGEVPLSIYNLSNIEAFEISENNLSGNLPTYVGTAFPHVQFFSVASNQLTGYLPLSLWNLSQLVYASVGFNNFIDSIPPEIGKLGSLVDFDVSANQLGGGSGDDLQFITSLTNCTNLNFLQAFSNNFHGSLPSSIANFSTNLQVLSIAKNKIYGTVHPDVRKLAKLKHLSLAFNLLTGLIPSTVGEISNLEKLYLGYNMFTGQIPSTFGNLTRLFRLSLLHTFLQGEIPQSLGKCANLDGLYLSSNRLTGPIPPLSRCVNLRNLDLSNNLLSSTIPSELFSFTSLDVLNLSHNLLSGPLSDEIGLWVNIHGVFISSNQLHGRIPEALGSCITLEYLDMHDNAFHGTIPQSLSALKALQEVDLSQNKLAGKIPSFFSNMSLVHLNLSYNDLNGEVPMEGVFRNMSAISLEGNIHLCGGMSELHLPPCTECKGNCKHKKVANMKLIFLAMGGSVAFIIAAAFVLLLLRSKALRKKTIPRSSVKELHMEEVSYRDLVNATNNFSPSNLIGRGSFGMVYKGVMNVNQMVVAVKVFNLEQTGASNTFISECEALQTIRHRNLVKVLTCCSGYDARGREFKALVFQFMLNGTLDSWLYPRSEPNSSCSRYLSLEARLDIALDVAHALDYLHNHCHAHIVHRDLKPTNILLDENMVAHVSDFGLAKILFDEDGDSSLQQPSTSKFRGTIGYIPPEYGTGSHVTTKGDVFSYGVILLEMVIGKKPTHEMFNNDLTLSSYARKALPNQIVEIVDPLLLPLALGADALGRINECIISIVEIGIKCSLENPSSRMDMGIVKSELELLRKQLSRGENP